MPNTNKYVTKPHSKKLLPLGIILIILLAVLYILIHHFFLSPKVSKISTPLTKLPKSSAPAQTNMQPSTSDQVNQGTSTDKQGQAPNNVSSLPSNWTTSESGAITVKSPQQNSTLKSGDTVYGSATVDKVQYRLIDDSAGVISQGFISVINGNFSASITFRPYASTGRLDVFNTDMSGKEINEVQLPVKLSS